MRVHPKFHLAIAMATVIMFTGCENDDNDLITEDVITNQTELRFEEDVPVTDNIPGYIVEDTTLRERVYDKEIVDLVQSLNIDSGRITKGLFHFPDGTSEERIFIGNDIVTSVAELEEMKKLVDASTTKQYRTFNLVTGSNRTIDILGYTGNDQFGLSNKAQTALQWAVNNYNRLSGVSLNFRLTYGTNFQAADMVVYDNSANNPGSQGGVAGFPNSQGRPNKFIQIYNIEQFSTNVNEHVITHEIGHSVGFRHSDWFDRLSCPPSSQGNEGAGSVGAVHVNGTPTGRDVTSVMQACFATNEDGEFTGNDIIALRDMY